MEYRQIIQKGPIRLTKGPRLMLQIELEACLCGEVVHVEGNPEGFTWAV